MTPSQAALGFSPPFPRLTEKTYTFKGLHQPPQLEKKPIPRCASWETKSHMPEDQTALQKGLKRLGNNESIKAPGIFKEVKPKVPRCQW